MDKPIRLVIWTRNLHNDLRWTPQSTLPVGLSTYTNLKQTPQSTLQSDLSSYTTISNKHPNQPCNLKPHPTQISNKHPNQPCNLTSRPTQISQMDTPINIDVWPLDLHNNLKWTAQSNLQCDLSTYTIISNGHPNQPCNLTSRATQYSQTNIKINIAIWPVDLHNT